MKMHCHVLHSQTAGRKSYRTWHGSVAIEHGMDQYFVFVDLKKACDSVPQTALWTALKKLGVPVQLVDTVKSFHEGMKARIRTEGDLLGEIDVMLQMA